ncbi:MAG: hypothetical protein NC548_24780 [Lachnospiraceae bacterium]|nr:hypothetical protein [Lachnospiraceae bacterium]
MYGISEKVIEKIVLNYIEDQKLFDKLKDEISELIECVLIEKVIGENVNTNLDTFKEISEWVEKHESDISNFIDDKVSKEDFENSIQDMATQTWVNNNNFITEHQSLDEVKSNILSNSESIQNLTKKHCDDIQIINESVLGLNTRLINVETNVNELDKDVNKHIDLCELKIQGVENKFNDLSAKYSSEISTLTNNIITNSNLFNTKIEGVENKLEDKITELTNTINNLKEEIEELKKNNIVIY